MDKKAKKYSNIISFQIKKTRKQLAKYRNFLMTNLRTSKYFKDKTEFKHKRQVIPKRDQILKKIIT